MFSRERVQIMKKVVLSGVFVLATASVWASGFGLYEASAPTYALGGAVLGRAHDASANFHNPATLTDLTNITVTAGFMTEHPRAQIEGVQGGRPFGSRNMNSGCYLLPHFHVAVPLPWNFAFGLGVMPEYGLGSKYDDSWPLNYGSVETEVTSFTVNPNLACKLTEKLSVAGGLRFLFWDFEQYSHPYSYRDGYHINNRLKGDNGMTDFGYQVGLKYDLLKSLSFGLVYKSLTVCHVEGKSETGGYVSTPYGPVSQVRRSAAEATLEMPQSLTGGFNWDVTDAWHVGGYVGWTQWSTISQVPFLFGDGSSQICAFNWKDTWRVGIAPSWDFAEGWKWMVSYVFESDCASRQYSTMLPPSNRHMISTGFAWNCWAGLEIALTYGMILMDGLESHVSKSVPEDTYRAYRGISHATGLTLTYRF